LSKMVRSIFISTLAFFVSSCRIGAPGKAQEAVSPKREKLNSEPAMPVSKSEPEAQAEPNIQWSPDQRQSQSGYHYLLGEMLFQRGNMRDASTMISSAYALDATPFLGARAIIAKAEADSLEEATKEAERLVLLYPRDKDAKVLYAQLLVRKGKFSEASIQLESVIKSQPKEELPYVMLIELYARAGSRSKARDCARKLTKIRPQSPVGWSMMARLNLLDGDKKGMLASASRAYKLQPSPDNAILYALALELSGKAKEALVVYEVAYKSADSSEKITSKLVDLYRQVGDLEEALRVLSDLQRSSGVSPSVGIEIQRVAILWELKRDDEALGILERLSKGDQRLELVATLLGYAYERVKRPDDAFSSYSKVPKEFPLYKEVGVRRCLILKEQGKLDEADALIKNYLSQSDPGWEFFVLAAEVASASGRSDQAIEQARAGSVRYPEQTRFLFLVAAYQEKAGKFQEAMSTIRELLKIEPDNSTALNFLGFLMVEQGEALSEAKKLIERALEIRPEDGAYLDSLGWWYFKAGDIVKAEELLLRAIKVSPDEGVIMEHLGEVAIKRGDGAAAVSWFEKAIQQKLEPRDRERIQGRLEGARRKK